MIDYEPFNAEEFYRWRGDNGDHTRRINYSLTKQDTVIDAGGYVGDWTQTIFDKYNPYIHIIEPAKEYCTRLESKFETNDKVHIHNFALGGSTREATFSVNGDSTTLYSETTEGETIACVDVNEFLKDEGIGQIALFKINIEGGEYELLERMIELNLMNRVGNFQIQFHRFIPDCKARRESIQKALSRTHTQTWNYDWIWENWELKK